MPLSEADTRVQLIDRVLHGVGWTEEHIKREETAGTIEIIAGVAHQRRNGRTDYTLRLKLNDHSQPVAIAVLEAKKESAHPSLGLEQCKSYCRRLNVPFVFASNGHLFVEFDRFTGHTSAPRLIAEFPTPATLQARYEAGMGFSLASPEAKPLLTPYQGGEAQRRYYQDAAIRAVLERSAQCIAKSDPARALLSLATGAGKTFIAVNLLKRIADAGQLRRALFLCDRDELRTQGLKAFQNAFGTDAAEAFRVMDSGRARNNAANARVHIVTYQTLGVDSEDGDASFLREFYPENYFSHIVIDECHRSAWGKWSQVLTRNQAAVQIGLTATPRELEVGSGAEAAEDEKITADNVKYFGEPCYEYGMAQAMEDGYLAACVIQKGRVNLDDTGISRADLLKRNPRDAVTGAPVSAEKLDRLYERTAYEDRLLLPDRVLAMCQDLFNYMLATGGPEQKTIIFCARDRHADDIAGQLNNLYADWCLTNGKERAEPYAFKCTANSSGNLQLPDLRGSSRSHFIATTVDLLTTGVDVPVIRNIVFFRYIKSPISFYQMVGRGTRIDGPTGKLMFTVYDYTDATRLFGQAFVTKLKALSEPKEGPGPERPPDHPVVVDGFDVKVTAAGRFVVAQVNGAAMPVPIERYQAELAARLVAEAPTLAAFRARWVDPPSRQDLLRQLVEGGHSPAVVRMLRDMDDYDFYDVLGELAYGLAPRTRGDRVQAFRFKHEDWLGSLPTETRATVFAIARQFEQGGSDSLENPRVFQLAEVIKAGGLEALRKHGKPADVLIETKARMFAA